MVIILLVFLSIERGVLTQNKTSPHATGQPSRAPRASLVRGSGGTWMGGVGTPASKRTKRVRRRESVAWLQPIPHKHLLGPPVERLEEVGTMFYVVY